MEYDYLIIGGGLSGLTLAYLLKKKGINALILEGADRTGGRIKTVNGTLGTPMELGATWFSDAHINLIELLDELGLHKFPQYNTGLSLFYTRPDQPPQQFYVPEETSPSYRLAGGTQNLIKNLMGKLEKNTIQLNTKVSKISAKNEYLYAETTDNRIYKARYIFLCLPPQLAGSDIKFEPSLPENLLSIMPRIQTWMAGSIKFILEYDQQFWRKAGFSGMIYSNAGIITEMYDHTNYEGNKFGFTGFLHEEAQQFSQEERKKMVLEQVAHNYGDRALYPLLYEDKIWTGKFLLSGNPIIRLRHLNNGHPLLQSRYMDDRLFFCATESSPHYPGYMEGVSLNEIGRAHV